MNFLVPVFLYMADEGYFQHWSILYEVFVHIDGRYQVFPVGKSAILLSVFFLLVTFSK